MLGLTLFSPLPVDSSQQSSPALETHTEANRVVSEPLREEIQDTSSPHDVHHIIHTASLKHGVDEQMISDIIKCESNYDPKAVGDGGASRGLVQIHRPSHPDITDEQAFDPHFAVEFITSEVAKGNLWMWSCARILGYV